MKRTQENGSMTIYNNIENGKYEQVETPYIIIGRDENFLRCVFNDQLEVNLEVAKNCVENRIRFSNGLSYPCLIDMKGVRSISKDAREYLATEGARNIKAGALIIDSALSKMVGNIFLTINKPAVPTKLFTNELEAKEWLKKYL